MTPIEALKQGRINGNRTHGFSRSGSKEFKAWISMKSRVKRMKGYEGIKIAKRWLSFEKFLQDVGRAPTKGHQLDRRKNQGHYTPGNVHWVTPSQNCRNRRTTVWLVFKGKRKPLPQWCEEMGLNDFTVRRRLAKGWSVSDALNPQDLRKRSQCRA